MLTLSLLRSMTYLSGVPVLYLKDKDNSTNLAGLGEE